MRNEEKVIVALPSYQGPYRQLEQMVEGPKGCCKVRYGATNYFKVRNSQLREMRKEQSANPHRSFTSIYEEVRRGSAPGWTDTPGCGKCICEVLIQDKRFIKQWWNSGTA